MKLTKLDETQKLKETIKSMGLNGHNGAIADAYFFAEEEQEALLQQVQYQQFHAYMSAWAVNTIFGHWSGMQQEIRKRFLKLSWAVGRSGSVLLWRGAGVLWSAHREDIVYILGIDAVLAMELEATARGLNIGVDVDHLIRAARKHPETLISAARLGGAAACRMEVLTAGLLLAFCEDPVYHVGQWECIRQAVLDNVSGLSPMEPGCLQALERYLMEEDPTQPLPPMELVDGRRTGQVFVLSTYSRNPGQFCPGDLLGAVCFLALKRRPEAMCAVRFFLMHRYNEALLGIFRLFPKEYILEHFDVLRRELKGGETRLLLYLAGGYEQANQKFCRTMMKCCLGSLNAALDEGNDIQRRFLKEVFPEEYAALNRDDWMDIVRVMCGRTVKGQEELREFLAGKGNLGSVMELRGVVHSTGDTPMCDEAWAYIAQHGWNDFSCRMVAVSTIALGCYIAVGYRLRQLLKKEEGFRSFRDAMLGQGLPMMQLLEILDNLAEHTYDREEKLLLERFSQQELAQEPYREAFAQILNAGSVFLRKAAVSSLIALGDKRVLQACGDSSKQVKELLLDLLPRHPEWAEDYAKLLTAKKTAERLMAVEVLARLGAMDVLAAALDHEKNSKVQDAIRSKMNMAPQTLEVCSAQDLAARILQGNKLRKLAWLTENSLPVLHFEDGDEAPEDVRSAILLSYSELGRIGRSDTAAQLAEGIRAEDLAALAVEVFEIWMGENAPAKQKWVLPFAAVFGGSKMTQRLRHAINDWPNNARGVIACDAVFALALSPDPAAIVIVDAISRKFKFRQVKVAAGQALENAAQELGITAEELADRIVPTLDFDRRGQRVFDYGKRSFTVRLTPTLELTITNQDGKPVKNLPAPGKTDDPMAADAYEAFKAMKKQIKTTVAAQRARLESALSVSRCWNVDRWRELFVENPIMHQFAMSLIWGVYEDGALTDTFRYMEDGSFTTVEEDEYELPVTGTIGLVHPVELDGETLEGWKQQLEDYEITQSIDQLSRPVYRLKPEHGEMRALEDFGGKVLNGLSLSGKLLGSGWYRGSVVDGGGFYDYYREDPGLGLAVELRFSGSFVGDENDDVTVFDAVFYRSGTVRRGSYQYDKPKEEDIFPLKDIPARYYSEIYHQLMRATASSTETKADWRKLDRL